MSQNSSFNELFAKLGLLNYLLVMGLNVRFGVPFISLKFDAETFLSAYLQSFDSPQKFCALTSEHRSDNEFNPASLLHVTQIFKIDLVLTALFTEKVLLAP